MTQIDKVHSHLESGFSITQAEALAKYGIARLAARINDLKNLGVEIKKRTVHRKNRFHEIIPVAEYYL